MNIHCPVCGDDNATCSWSADSDGASWTWITWSHYCAHCGYSVKKVTQDAYNHEDVENCQLPDHRPAFPDRPGGKHDVVHALNRNINKPTELAQRIVELQDRLRQLDLFETRARRTGGVFVSYSHADRAFVDQLVSRLENDKINVWRDEKEILIGDVIDRAVSEGIQQSWIFLIVVTPHSVTSRWVARELDEASHEEVEGRKIVLPVVAEGLDLAQFLARVRRKKCAVFGVDFETPYTALKVSILAHLKTHAARTSSSGPVGSGGV